MEIRSLLQVQKVPDRWWRAVMIVYAANIFVIIGCIVSGQLIYGDTAKMFGEAKPGTMASVAVLAGAGVVCLRIRKRLAGTPLAGFWLAFGVLMCLAAADDMMRIHEHVDRYIHQALRRDPLDPITNHLDDLIVGMYVLPAAYLGLLYRKSLIAARLTLQVLAVAFVIFAVHLAFDVLGWSMVVEESLKLTAGCTIMLAFLATQMLPTLPASWTKSRAESPELDGGVPDVAAWLRVSRRWVRITAMTAFAATACAVVAAIFTCSAATRSQDTSHRLLLNASTLLLVLFAGAVFWAGHCVFTYAAQIGVAGATPVRPARRQDRERAQVAAWRAVSIASVCAVLITLTLTIWACRLDVPQKGKRPRPPVVPSQRTNEME